MKWMVLILTLLQGGITYAAAEGTERELFLSVPGMTCPVCPITVRKALKDVPGVREVQVDYDSKRARVRFDSMRVRVEDLQKATADAGYPSEPIAAAADQGR